MKIKIVCRFLMGKLRGYVGGQCNGGFGWWALNKDAETEALKMIG